MHERTTNFGSAEIRLLRLAINNRAEISAEIPERLAALRFYEGLHVISRHQHPLFASESRGGARGRRSAEELARVTTRGFRNPARNSRSEKDSDNLAFEVCASSGELDDHLDHLAKVHDCDRS
jgi:hypothetical protein